jgi:hypothetical protein
MFAYLKISAQPCCDFCNSHRYRKINKDRRADSCEADEGADSESTVAAHFGCLSFITEFVEVSFNVAPGFLVLKNVPLAPRDFPGHFLGVRGGRPAGFCVVLGSGKLGEGRLG